MMGVGRSSTNTFLVAAVVTLLLGPRTSAGQIETVQVAKNADGTVSVEVPWTVATRNDSLRQTLRKIESYRVVESIPKLVETGATPDLRQRSERRDRE